MRLALIDYDKGNISSVERAFADCGTDVFVTSDPVMVGEADAIVLPGVGAFTDAMETLDKTGFSDAIRDGIKGDKPFLGICLGMHLMFEGGLEHAEGAAPTGGLGILPGVVKRLPAIDEEGRAYKIPHVGWNSVESPNGKFGSPLLRGIDPGEYFYFTHSYASPESPFTIAETTHSVTFPSVVGRARAFGVQFHPEKSSCMGARIISNFIDLVHESGR